ncbi:hypothetical protein EGK_16572 [Macaca mulatta]|uniref:Core Histone H2A/H2B/H3 domain-containing protein n=2 Tax=Macaca TaxID=9539 RepID=F7H134_MACMU|nr:hypothetical protein EGK_16572 [Macaca mulatta]EHH54320.1 hypothetical protein EGM_15134 [Macaca fascicularis]
MARSSTKKHKYSKRHQSPTSRKKAHSSIDFVHGNYSFFVNKVLKEVVSHRGTSSRTLDLMNTLINNFFQHISMKAYRLMYFRNRCTLTPEDILKAAYLLLPQKTANYAVAFGSEVFRRYVHS